eukprot:5649373-Ditylum_brightwellii.AAC.2
MEEDNKTYLEFVQQKGVGKWGWAESNILKNFTIFASSNDNPAEFHQQGGAYIGVTVKLGRFHSNCTTILDTKTTRSGPTKTPYSTG